MKQKISGLKAIGNGTYNDSRKRTIYGDLKIVRHILLIIITRDYTLFYLAKRF